MIKKSALEIGIGFIVLKILYIITIALMLPDKYLIWSFDKKVDLALILIELIPFTICLFLYLKLYEGHVFISFFSTIVFMMTFIPSNSVLSLSRYNLKYYVLTQVYYILFFEGLLFLGNKKLRFNKGKNNAEALCHNKQFQNSIHVGMIVICMILITYVYMYNRLDFGVLFGANNMYEVRAKYAEYIAKNTGRAASYLYIIISNLYSWFMPIFFYYALVWRKKFDIALCLFTYTAYFTMTMQKGILMMIPVIFIIVFLQQHMGYKKLLRVSVKAFIGMFIVALIEYLIRGKSLIFELIIRREFYIPSYMCEKYYSFFSVNPKEWFTHDAFILQNITQKLLGNYYSSGATTVISQQCFGGILPSPNTGFFAEAYTQCGEIGILIFPIIVCFIIGIIEKIANWYGKGVVLVVLVKLYLAMNSTFLLTSLSIIGIIQFIGITWFIKKIWKQGNKNRVTQIEKR